MESKKIKKLDTMLGKSYLYLGDELKLLSYKVTGEKVDIVGNKYWITTNVFDLETVLGAMKEIHLPQVSLDEAFKQNTKYISVRNDSINKAQDSLLEMLDKVKEDRVNIEQAKAVVDIANSIVNSEKLKLEQLTLLNKIQQL